MSDSDLSPAPLDAEVPALDAPPAAALSPPTAGQMLRNARLAAGLGLEELAARVKVPVARLQALEEDRFDSWPDMTVVRAVAASVCRHVRLDAAVILARLPKAEKMVWSSVVADSSVGFREKDGFKMRASHGVGRLPLALLALAFVLGALGLYLGPLLQTWFDPAQTGQTLRATSAAQASPTEPVLPPDAEPTDTRVGAVAPESGASLPEPMSAAATPSKAPSSAAAVVYAPQQAASISVAGTVVEGKVISAQTAAPSSPLLVFKARGLTWVAVSDAKGAVLLRKTLAAGETASASGELPLWVVVGRADNTEVQVRGQAMKLEPSGPENVARFKVQ